MGIFDKLFARKSAAKPAGEPAKAAPTPAAPAPVPKPDPSLPKPGEPVRDMPATPVRDQLITLWNSYAPNDERIRKCIAMKPLISGWSDAEKSFYYLILGNAIGARSKWEDDRRFPFFAASVFYNPINTNSAWHDLNSVLEGMSICPATAQKLFVRYPLPEDFQDLMTPLGGEGEA